MKLTPPLTLALLGALFLGSPARAGGTIDATQYMPVGSFDAWEMIDKDLWNGGAGPKDEPQIISVAKTTVVDGVPRYNVRTKFFASVDEAMLQFGIDGGVVYLFGMKIIDPGEDLGVDNLNLPTIFFEPPVPVGDTATPLDTDFATTPISATVEAELKIGHKKVEGSVDIEGSVTARWNSQAPIDTPLGTLGGGADPLAELAIGFTFSYTSDNEDINDALEGVVTDKGVSLIMGPGLGFVQVDGEGGQAKILNRAILPGELVSNPAEPDAFPEVPPGDLASFSLPVSGVVTLDNTVNALGDGGISDGVVTLDDVQLFHALNGDLHLLAQVSAGGDGPVDLDLNGSARPNFKTGGLRVKLKGKTKQLPDFAKSVSFKVNQELPPPLDTPTSLTLTYDAGKDPDTHEPITGTLLVPVTPFVATSATVTLNRPVDVPKIKSELLVVKEGKRTLGAEGVLTLTNDALGDGGGKPFPVTFRETVTPKEGQPAVRTAKLTETGQDKKLLQIGATSTSPADYALTKLSGKLIGVKLLLGLEEVDVTAQ